MAGHNGTPEARGLYDPDMDKDACGVGFVGELSREPKRAVITDALKMLDRMTHRGACGCEENTGDLRCFLFLSLQLLPYPTSAITFIGPTVTVKLSCSLVGFFSHLQLNGMPMFPGDGAGILCSIPLDFFQRVAYEDMGINLPEEGKFGIGQLFLPVDDKDRPKVRRLFADTAAKYGHKILGWRKVPIDNSMIGPSALRTEPKIEQVFVSLSDGPHAHLSREQQMFVLRKLAEKAFSEDGYTQDEAYFCSLSTRTIVYKGQLTPAQVPQYFLDLQAEDFSAFMALVHSRFSTNTFPNWSRAQPMRMLGHNGEINTLRGNKNWMKAREGTLSFSKLGLGKETVRQVGRIPPQELSCLMAAGV